MGFTMLLRFSAPFGSSSSRQTNPFPFLSLLPAVDTGFLRPSDGVCDATYTTDCAYCAPDSIYFQ